MAQYVLTIIAVEHFDKSVAFHKAAFDWAVTVEGSVYAEFLLPGGQRFGVYERLRKEHRTDSCKGLIADGAVLLFRQPQGGDRPHRGGRRARVEPPLAAPVGDEAAYFADPSGTVLVLARPRP